MNKNLRIYLIIILTCSPLLSIANAIDSPTKTSEKSPTHLEDYLKMLLAYKATNMGGQVIEVNKHYLHLNKPISEPQNTITPQDADWLAEMKRKSYEEEMRDYSEKLALPQKLLRLTNNTSDFFTKKIDNKTYLELLYHNNLGWIADEICTILTEQGIALPNEYILLRTINNGGHVKVNTKEYSKNFIQLAFRVANDANNLPMVQQLFPLSGIDEEIEHLKTKYPQIFSPDGNFVHEPYWSYNLDQLQKYGYRILEKLKPHIVPSNAIHTIGGKPHITIGQETLKLRSVPFSYVLANLYLKNRFTHEKVTNLAVARIFLIPKRHNIKFTFVMPYPVDDSGKLYEGTRNTNNPLQVMSEEFEVYQEIIEGKALANQRYFEKYGHRDFNNYQIIESKDGKLYLIDTKEDKNFMVPYLTANKEFRDPNSDEWHKVIYAAKSLNFDPRVVLIDIEVKLPH